MRGNAKRGARKIGAAPGTLLHIGERKQERVRMYSMAYDGQQVKEGKLSSLEEAFPLPQTPATLWINIDGIHNLQVIEQVGERFGIHPLTLEDILNTGQRPKAEDFETYIYIVLKMLDFDERQKRIQSEQVSLIFTRNFLLSFQETEGDIFDPVRERIRRGKGRIGKGGCDYLAYALIDAIVDKYFLILEKLGEALEELEEELLANPKPRTLQTIHGLKQEMIYLRKQAWPIRELTNNLVKSESPLIQDPTGIFLNDVYDHTIQVMDTIESYRDILSGMLDLYMSTLSNRMNEVMKVLTIIATIFIPITFLAGVYGMNFQYMPELAWRWGYLAIWVVMIGVAGIMLFYFKKKKWL
jgi:magnesium transporter